MSLNGVGNVVINSSGLLGVGDPAYAAQPGVWSGGDPLTLNEAVNRLAAYVAFIHSPIP